jgi:Mn2+/Fe2+ NRAMP family transporter
MRAAAAYTSARILLFAAAVAVLYLIGARGLILLALALLISGLVSYVVLSKARDRMSASLSGRLTGMRSRMKDFGQRLDEGAKVEDEE